LGPGGSRANSRISAIRSVPRFLFNLVFPDDCRLCEQPLFNVSRIPVCTSCLSLPQPLEAEFSCQTCRTPFLSSYPLDHNGQCAVCRENAVNFDCAYFFGNYDGPLRKLIQIFKYGKVESLAGPLSALLARAVPRDQNFDVVIAMPMHWRKQWERGFNQAELLARPIARRYGLRLAANLRRKRYTAPQAGLSEAGRRQNLKGSFTVARPAEIAGKRVLLIDDVFTTGATLRAATAALKSAGAARVGALTLARVDARAPAAMNLDTDFSSTGLAPLGRALAENDARRRVSAGSGIS
jgi:ComF family protein